MAETVTIRLSLTRPQWVEKVLWLDEVAPGWRFILDHNLHRGLLADPDYAALHQDNHSNVNGVIVVTKKQGVIIMMFVEHAVVVTGTRRDQVQ